MLAQERFKTAPKSREADFRQRFGDELASYTLALNRRGTPGSVGFVRVERKTEVEYVDEARFHKHLAQLLLEGLGNHGVSGISPSAKKQWLADLFSEANKLEPSRIHYVDKSTTTT